MKRPRSFSLRNVLAMQFIMIAIAPVVMAGLFLYFQGTPQKGQEVISALQIPAQIESILDKQAALLGEMGILLGKQAGTHTPTIGREKPLTEKNIAFDVIYRLGASGELTIVFQKKIYLDKNSVSKAAGETFIRTALPDMPITEPFWTEVFISPVTGLPSSACIIPLDKDFLVGEISSSRLTEILKEHHAPATWAVLDKKTRW